MQESEETGQLALKSGRHAWWRAVEPAGPMLALLILTITCSNYALRSSRPFS